MDGVELAIEVLVEEAIHFAVRRAGIDETDVVRVILRLRVEGTRDGDTHLVSDVDGPAGEEAGEIALDDVRAFKGGTEQFIVWVGKAHPVMADVGIEGPEIDGAGDEKPFLPDPVLVRADDAHLMPRGTHLADDVHRGNRGAVIFLSEDVADECDDHNSILGKGFHGGKGSDKRMG